MKKLLFLSAFLTTSAFANLQADDVAVSFLITKITTASKGITEHYYFKSSTAMVDSAGKLTAQVDLSSLDSGIPIRDERIQQNIFNKKSSEGKLFIDGQVDIAKLEALKVGEKVTIEQPLNLMLGDKTISTEANLLVIRQADNSLLVTTSRPMLVDFKNFAIDEGVAELIKIMSLANISLQVPVSLQAQFMSK